MYYLCKSFATPTLYTAFKGKTLDETAKNKHSWTLSRQAIIKWTIDFHLALIRRIHRAELSDRPQQAEKSIAGKSTLMRHSWSSSKKVFLPSYKKKKLQNIFALEEEQQKSLQINLGPTENTIQFQERGQGCIVKCILFLTTISTARWKPYMGQIWFHIFEHEGCWKRFSYYKSILASHAYKHSLDIKGRSLC